VIDVSAVQMLLLTVTSWLERREREVLAYLIEENGSCGGSCRGGAYGSPMTRGSKGRSRTSGTASAGQRLHGSSEQTGSHRAGASDIVAVIPASALG
jgi:hypothetical protein